ncbi:hypothetical protein CXG81DRAFT_9023, partial [Caulochytrium protostelioides]
SAEVEEFDEQMQELLTGIRTVLEKEVSKMRGQERLEKCNYLRNRLQRAKQVHRSIVVEVRELPPDKAMGWSERAREYETTILKYMKDVEWAESTANETAKAGTAGALGVPGGPGSRNVEEMTAKDMTQQALQIQDKTQESALRAKRMVEETIQIGAVVNSDLAAQGDQLNKIQDDVAKVETNLKRADKQIRVFMRRLASDKVFIILILLVVLGLIATIVVAILKKQGVIGDKKVEE